MILNIYKPKGWTSFDVVAKVRSISGEKKVGHAGTLDPLAEGVLIVLTGKDTKNQDTFKDFSKKYYFEFILGVSTPSIDLEFSPKLVNPDPVNSLESRLQVIIDKFTGEFDQQAPVFSAKKVDGKRLYDVARQNLKDLGANNLIVPPIKRISIYELVLVGTENQELETDSGIFNLQVVKMSVHCSSGTYVRSLASDIAKELESTAVVSKLVRTQIGPYNIENSVRLEDLKF